MGSSLRYFIVEDHGTLTRVPIAKYQRWFFDDEALPANRAGRELRLLEVAVVMDHHRVVDVLRIHPVRHRVREDGRLDARSAMRLALKRLDILGRVRAGDAWAQIEQLEADAVLLVEAQIASSIARPVRPKGRGVPHHRRGHRSLVPGRSCG